MYKKKKATLVAKRVLNTLEFINTQLYLNQGWLMNAVNLSMVNQYHKKIMSLIIRANFYFKVADNLIATYGMNWQFNYEDNYTLREDLKIEIDRFKSFMKSYF